MRNDLYPAGIVKELLKTDLVAPNTKQVLNDRLTKDIVLIPHFFTKENFATLQAVCKRLVPQPPRQQPVDLAGLLEEDLFTGSGNGWRYASMPEDKQAIISGLTGIDDTAQDAFGTAFHLLETSHQDSILSSVQNGTAAGKSWALLPVKLFFEELLAKVAELYYSHPSVKEEIGDVSFADNNGWKKIGLGQMEAYEPKIIN